MLLKILFKMESAVCYMVKSVYYGSGAEKNSVLDICK